MRRLLARLGVAVLVAAAPIGVYLLPEEQPAWDPRILEEVRFVERARGLAFDHPVPVRFLSDERFTAELALGAPTEDEVAHEDDELAVLRALGLVTGSANYAERYDPLLAAGVEGWYDSEREVMLVRGEELTPYVRGTLVHELTHALQDQRFDLDALDGAHPDVPEEALAALVEGDATRIEELYVDQLPDAEQSLYSSEAETAATRPTAGWGASGYLARKGQFPYVFGPVLLDHLVDQGGNAAVDEAFRHPPRSQAEVLHPGERNVPATVPDPRLPLGAEPLSGTPVMGEAALLHVLGTRFGFERSWPVVQRWAGDAMQLYRLDDRVCVAVVVRADDPAATRAWAALARTWASEHPLRAAHASGLDVRFRSCDPGPAGATITVQPADAFDVLERRAALVHELARAWGDDVASLGCLVDQVIARAGGKAFLDGTDPDSTTEEEELLAEAFDQADGCGLR